ncbi:MAG: hypothetical protein PHY48_00740 [Candidatus Cloacimonetes bacterium]|nr:hypothetical protein [Candidatus Cloacimonadota bacterium]
MVKLTLVFILLSIFVCAWAQVEELPELHAEELHDNWLQNLFDELNASKAILSVNSRTRIYPDYSTALYALQCKDKEFSLNVNLSTRDNSTLRANFQVQRSTTESILTQFSFGYMTPAWALGTVLKKNSEKNKLFRLGNAGSPDYITPKGMGAMFKVRETSAFIMFTQQSRPVKFNNGSINTLYATHHDGFSQATETIATAGVETEISKLRVGALGYFQGYDYPFSNEDYVRHLTAFSIAAKLDTKLIDAACEAAFIEGKPAVKAVVSISQDSCKHRLGFSQFQNIQFPAYAARSGVLSSKGLRSEFNWDLDFPASKNVSVAIHNAISRKNNSIQSPAWLSRNILYLSYHPNATSVGLQLSRYNRELIAYEDSTYLATLPTHYRCSVKIKHELNNNIGICFNYRYVYQDQISKERNSFYWENYLTLKHQKLKAQIGHKNWQSMYNLAIPDANLGSQEGIYMVSSEDNQVFAKLSYRFRSFHVATELNQSWLDGKRSIFLNLGI